MAIVNQNNNVTNTPVDPNNDLSNWLSFYNNQVSGQQYLAPQDPYASLQQQMYSNSLFSGTAGYQNSFNQPTSYYNQQPDYSGLFGWIQQLQFFQMFSSMGSTSTKPQFKLTSTQDTTKATVETNNYIITATGGTNWDIKDKTTGQSLLSAGDPHLFAKDANGATIANGKDWTNGVMTFMLPDGTKVTAKADGPHGVTRSFNVYTPDGQYSEVKDVATGAPKVTSHATGGLQVQEIEDDGDIVAVGGGGNSLYEVNKDLNADGKVDGGKYFGETADGATQANNAFFDQTLRTWLNYDQTKDVSEQWDAMANQYQKPASNPWQWFMGLFGFGG